MEKLNIFEIPREICVVENVPLVIHPMKSVHQLCTQPYYKHPKGCPNFNNKDKCPSDILHISEEYDCSDIHMFFLKFSFSEYIDQKKQIHPTWNFRQLYNQRHWQGHLRSQLNQYWESIEDRYPEHELIENPEAQGVNIQETLKQINVEMEWPSEEYIPEYVYHVYLLGKRLG